MRQEANYDGANSNPRAEQAQDRQVTKLGLPEVFAMFVHWSLNKQDRLLRMEKRPGTGSGNGVCDIKVRTKHA
jgi:hypothetical protein